MVWLLGNSLEPRIVVNNIDIPLWTSMVIGIVPDLNKDNEYYKFHT